MVNQSLIPSTDVIQFTLTLEMITVQVLKRQSLIMLHLLLKCLLSSNLAQFTLCFKGIKQQAAQFYPMTITTTNSSFSHRTRIGREFCLLLRFQWPFIASTALSCNV